MFMGSWLLWVGCGPAAVAADTDTDTDGETDTEGSATDGAASANPSGTADPTADSMSGSDSADPSTKGDPPDPTGDASDGDADTEDPGDTMTSGSETGADCPFGGQGCLCDVGARCDEGLDCNDDGVCVPPPDCRPIDETPHDDEATAVELEEVGCNEGVELDVIGTVEGPQTDWYTYAGNDGFTCVEQPTAIVVADADLVVCVFLECNQGDVQQVECGAESTDSASPDGRPGCCGTNIAFVNDYDCSGFGGKSADVFVSVASADDVCLDYSLEYGF
jgi:hypothetical protein